MKVMFSIHVGDSIAHVLRTRSLALKMISAGHKVKYLAPRRVRKYLAGYVPQEYIVEDSQHFGFSRLETLDKVTVLFCEKVASEYEIYKSFCPDVVIGDMGLTASVYCIDKLLIKIINRFPLEVGIGENSILTQKQRQVVISQVERLINQARNLLGIEKPFVYSEFLSPPTILHGASSMVEYGMPNLVSIGYLGRIRFSNTFIPNPLNVFISLGTGVSPSKESVLLKVLDIVEPKCEKIYIGIGTKKCDLSIPIPKRANVRPIFEEYPADAGRLVCHGGYGILHSGLLAGVRIDTFPFHIEHLCNSARIVALGKGYNYGNLRKGPFEGLSHKIEYNFEDFYNNFDIIPNNFTVSTSLELCSDNDLYKAVSEIIDKHL